MFDLLVWLAGLDLLIIKGITGIKIRIYRY